MKPNSYAWLALILILALGSSALLASVRISEFQANNVDTITDEDGDKSDWIEIRNPDAIAAVLTGMALTDDPLLLQKWIFPPGVTIPARGQLLVWASSKNRINASATLHTNFKLKSSEGSYLALVDADGATKITEFASYPEQFPDRSYGSTQLVTTSTVVSTPAACRWFVPLAQVPGWEQLLFNDSTWTTAKTGIGYDTVTTNTNYNPLIGPGGNTKTQMSGLRNTVYIRIPFSVPVAANVNALTLRAKWEDGFAAFLNGTRLSPPTASTTNAPGMLAFGSNATATRADGDAVSFATYDVSAQRSALVNGQNVLAIQSMNASTSSSDLLMVPELDVTTVDPVLKDPGYIAEPSPGLLNSRPIVLGFIDAPDFSVKRGFFTATFSLTLTTGTLGAAIRYTTNGSPPTDSTGTEYTGPLTISTTTALRAAAFIPGYETSTVKTQTYIFPAQVLNQPELPAGYPAAWGNAYNFAFDTLTGPPIPADYRMDPAVTRAPDYSSLLVPALSSTLPVVCITTRIPEMFDFSSGIYSNQRLANKEIEASIEYFNPLDATGTDRWQEDAGLRMHGGNAPLEHPKKPFRIYFRKQYGADKLRYPLYPGSPVDEFDKLQLRPGGHDSWAVPFGSADTDLATHATYMRDRFLRQCELDMGRLAHRGRYVHLYINGLYWGFYDLHEVIDARFFAAHKGGAREDWDVIEHSNTSNPLFDIVEGDGDAMDAVLALVRPPTNMESDASYAALQQYIPVDELIDNLIVQMWGAQNDWMGPVFRGVPNVNLTDASRFFNKNWESGRRSRGLLPGDGFFWQVWDAEISMGQSLATELVPSMRVTDFNHTLIGTPVSEIARAAGTPGPIAEIYYALRKNNASFRRRFADRLQKHFFNDGALTKARMQARLQSFRDQLDLPVVPESARWGDVNSGNPIVVTMTRNTHWRPEMDWMRDTYTATRTQTLLNQFAAIGMWPSVSAPSFSQHGGNVPQGNALTMIGPAGGIIYYTLDGSDPALPAGAQTVEFIVPSSDSKYIVPTFAYSSTPPERPASNLWKNIVPPSDIANWLSGTAALGFDANTTFGPHILTAVTGMRNVNSSLYIRIPFSVTAEQKSQLTSLTLQIKYDDGAYTWLNGDFPIDRLNIPTNLGAPSFRDMAATSRPDGDAVVYESIDYTSLIPRLVAGSQNLLAIQGLNVTAADNDFLCSVRLVGELNSSGQPAAGAMAYLSAVPLNQTATVKARVLLNSTWSPLTEASFLVGVPASSANLVISEFSYNPGAPTPAEIAAGFTSAQMFEFIELYNISPNLVQLTGCHFDDGILFDFTASSSAQEIGPGQRIVIASNPAAFAFRHPGVAVVGSFQSGSNLANGGEGLKLTAANGGTIFDFNYDDIAPWPMAADGDGFSLILICPSTDPDPALPPNWRSSAGAFGLPGASDGDSFAAWASRNSVSGSAGDDPDQNGLSSFLEYALGTLPPAGSDGFLSAGFEILPALSATDTYLVIRYRTAAAADDAVVIPQFSTDLTTWTTLTDEAAPPVADLATGTILRAVRSPLSSSAVARAHVRLLVESRK